jgi:hypothetical protein
MIRLKNIVNGILAEEEKSSEDTVANNKGYNIKNIYHGTTEKFNVFKFDTLKNVKASDTDKVIYATDSEEEAKIAGSPDSGRSKVMKLYGKLKNPMVVDAKGTEKNKSFGTIGYKKLIQMAKSRNHDGAIIKNVIDFGNTPQTTYIFFDTKAVKLAGETKDNSGNLIPLSQRFNSTVDDLRF